MSGPIKFNFPKSSPSARDVTGLHAILERVGFRIAEDEKSAKNYGATTRAALKQFQSNAGIAATSRMNRSTVRALRAEIEDRYFTDNKRRASKVQRMLLRLSYKIADKEINGRTIGPTTTRALKGFQRRSGLLADGRMSLDVLERLQLAEIDAQIKRKTQVKKLHRKLISAIKIGGVDAAIDPQELKDGKLGESTGFALGAFQKKFKLDETGKLNPATLEKLTSVAASRKKRKKLLRAPAIENVSVPSKVLRLNATNKHVGELQKSLAHLGFKIERKEFNTRKFGKTTRAAVIAFQKSVRLPQTGHFDKTARKALNRRLGVTDPTNALRASKYRVRGSVRDELWKGKQGVMVQVWERPLRGDGKLLAERRSSAKGFYDIPYEPPRNAVNGQIKKSFQLKIRVLDSSNQEVGVKFLSNPTPVAWKNFTDGAEPYRGTSAYATQITTVSPALDGVDIAEIQESPEQRDLAHISLNSGANIEDVLRLSVSHRLASKVPSAEIGPEVTYAFVAQNLPASLPNNLESLQREWSNVDDLVESAVQEIVFMENEQQESAFDNAVRQNLIPIEVARKKTAILGALAEVRPVFALEKPLLSGGGSLQQLMVGTGITGTQQLRVATEFLNVGCFGIEFWGKLKLQANQFGGISKVNKFESNAGVGSISTHHQPTFNFLNQTLSNNAEPTLNKVPDFAKLDQTKWRALIDTNGGAVPDEIEGNSAAAKKNAYAKALRTESERLYPAIALAAEVGRGNQESLDNLNAVATFLDNHPDLDLQNVNLDQFVSDNDLNVQADVLNETKLLQRVMKLAPNARVGRMLVENKFHDPGAILFAGKEMFVKKMESSGVDRDIAKKAYVRAEGRYRQSLMHLAEFRGEIHLGTPNAIVSQALSSEERKEILGESPNIETLFGSADFCECKHCNSMYSPAAYITDVLRFLGQQPQELDGSKTARDLLLERRSDIGQIKLNCDNALVPLPYIDLVCEILENAIPAPATTPAFQNQTTRSAETLRAFPEHVRAEAYDVIRRATFPMDCAFDLWQEESRIWLNHLGVPRHKLMQTFHAKKPDERVNVNSATKSQLEDLPIIGAVKAQAIIDHRMTSGPFVEIQELASVSGITNANVTVLAELATTVGAEASAAAEYFGISATEVALIVNSVPDETLQRDFWAIKVGENLSDISVRDLIYYARLKDDTNGYQDVLSMVNVQWLSPLSIETNGSCDLYDQMVENLDAALLDKMQRFLRLWRRTEWKMWQLDLLVRSAAIGNGDITEKTLIRMHEFDRIRDQLGISFEQCFSLFDALPDESRVDVEDADRVIASFYDRLFQNPSVSDPVDPALALAQLDGTNDLEDHKPTLRSALGLSEDELNVLLEMTGKSRNIKTLTNLHNFTLLSRRLDATVRELVALLNLLEITDLSAQSGILQKLLDDHTQIKQSSFSIGELDYLLNHNPDSSFGLREEATKEILTQLRVDRSTAVSASDADGEDQIIDSMATAFSMTTDRMRLCLGIGPANGTILDVLKEKKLIQRKSENGAEFEFQIDTENFQNLFDVVIRLHKISLLLNKANRFADEDVDWLIDKPGNVSLLSLAELPFNAPIVNNLFQSWSALDKWHQLVARFPEPEGTSFRSIFALASVNGDVSDIEAQLSKITQWSQEDLKCINESIGYRSAIGNNDFLRMNTYSRIVEIMDVVSELAVSTKECVRWSTREIVGDQQPAEIVKQIRETAKAKYEVSKWLDIATPLMDVLREKKRDALVSFLLGSSVRDESSEVEIAGVKSRNPKFWRDSDDLLQYYLIEVSMSSCQLSSRIKQAISSIQLFVQRCFLNLEQPLVQVSREEREDTVSDNSWRQWRYIKNYRVWEAARKIFFYPENWIEPELREDKTPFFKELEDELFQGEITHDTAETSLRHYLEKLDEVSRLEVVGVFQEQNRFKETTVEKLHVVARTKGDPVRYFYRVLNISENVWGPWEKIDVEITGEHVVPIVYNSRLYLFWLVIAEKPQRSPRIPPAKESSVSQRNPEPPNLLELQLAWSERTEDGWTSKTQSKQKLIHPWDRPLHSYTLKSRYKRDTNLLWLDVYISTSKEFNASQFFDPIKNAPARMTSFDFDETGSPWHSSSFVFDGAVTDVKMKPRKGSYYMLKPSGEVSGVPSRTDSLRFVQSRFGEEGRTISALRGGNEIAPRLMLPDGMHFNYGRLANNKVMRNDRKLDVLQNGVSKTVLQGANSPFELVYSNDDLQFDTVKGRFDPTVYQDRSRSFVLKPENSRCRLGNNSQLERYKYRVLPFYHPYSGLLLRQLNQSGIDALLQRRLQVYPHSFAPKSSFNFDTDYQPEKIAYADQSTKTEKIDFSRYGAYATYNWEVFFHIPILIACGLNRNQRFEEAMRWFHYVFDPTSTDGIEDPQRYWRTKPFYDQNAAAYRKKRIENLLRDLRSDDDELAAWRNNPFKPHLIARHRPIAYQKMVVMKYIDNLIDWGDQLFRQDSLESINEATQLYVLAYEILGPKPIQSRSVNRVDKSFEEISQDDSLDPLGNSSTSSALDEFSPADEEILSDESADEYLPLVDTLYFCIPPNEELLEYWDRVEDRLFKIRHCMNIEGIIRQLPLFRPPINPMLLVQASAAGVDIASELTIPDAKTSPYRYRTMAAKAAEFCNEVRSLGDKLLGALEKKDAEELAMLRSSHETALLESSLAVRRSQIDEAQQSIGALQQTRRSAEERKNFYESREFISAWEGTALSLSTISAVTETAIAISSALAGQVKVIPDVTVGGSGFGGSPHVVSEVFGGSKIGGAADSAVQVLRAIVTQFDKYASLANTMGSYERRKEDWDNQKRLAEIDVAQTDRQIAAAEIRKAIAERELDNLDRQIERSKTVEDYYRDKFTNEQLYGWMVQQISTIYFQAYKLAYDLAFRAEKSLQHELGRPDLKFVEFDYWDSLKKGLLAGERLSQDLRRMDSAFFEEHQREFEITKHISLADINPEALIQLKTNGECTFEIPEWMYDMDYPGQYRRRIKSVAVTIPCVAGPFTGVNAVLTLNKDGIRLNSDIQGLQYDNPLVEGTDVRFNFRKGLNESIATSNAQNDSGVFSLNFGDERFLPFEGAGAVSEWTLKLPKETNRFDIGTVSDAVIHVSYTSTSGSDSLATAATDNLKNLLPTAGLLLFDLKRDGSSSWLRFLNPTPGTDQELKLNIEENNFPFYTRGKTIRVNKTVLVLQSDEGGKFEVILDAPAVNLENIAKTNADPEFGGAQVLETNVAGPTAAIGEWRMKVRKENAGDFAALSDADIAEAYLVVNYET